MVMVNRMALNSVIQVVCGLGARHLRIDQLDIQASVKTGEHHYVGRETQTYSIARLLVYNALPSVLKVYSKNNLGCQEQRYQQQLSHTCVSTLSFQQIVIIIL
ncbi:uncharacterized protein LOC110454212 [Mizuhopecten yessoensis]|uniref:uncharacterized protein LOC110454212 n=1 Tax=Mizuhopecten yessoensis TaxID=6573 RepID=UPI000B45C540|nr:uncharacterized protein LOC110454212 [Mizuhopecten yessoensis]